MAQSSVANVRQESSATKEVPAVALNIKEYRDTSIRLSARRSNESDAGGGHPRVRRLEIINAQEETDPPRELIANDRLLSLAVGACEQNARTAGYWAHNDPALRTPIIRQRRNVLHELELEDFHKKIDGWLVLPHNQSNQLELRHQLRPTSKRVRVG